MLESLFDKVDKQLYEKETPTQAFSCENCANKFVNKADILEFWIAAYFTTLQ